MKHKSDKALLSKKYKNHLSHNNKMNNLAEKWATGLKQNTSSKKKYRWKGSIWRGIRHYTSLGNCKLKQHWGLGLYPCGKALNMPETLCLIPRITGENAHTKPTTSTKNMRYHRATIRMVKIQNINNIICWEDCRKQELWFVACGNAKMIQPLWKTDFFFFFLHKTKHTYHKVWHRILSIYPNE